MNDRKEPKYRADIDGLRAVAVLAVVAFHAFPQVVRGGFIGVDIFFVISGFLITSIIVENVERFDLRDFYARRIRRIFPALALVLVACLGIGWLVLTGEEMGQLGKHVLAAAAFVSNVVLWGESGYFDESAETKPLLHLWSLGIEEQFYVVWPLLIWSAYLLRLNLLTAIGVVGAASFVLNIVLVQHDNVAAFYSPLTRAWELAMGGMLACLVTTSPKQLFKGQSWSAATASREAAISRLKDGLSLAGGVVIAVGLISTTNGRAYPGVQALLPTIGTALLIVAGPQAVLNRCLMARRGLVWIGLISYPLYLWHWPLLAFARIAAGGTASLEVRLAVIGLSLALAVLTYRLLERPLRFGAPPGATAAVLLGSMAAIGLFGFGMHKLIAPGSGAFAKVVNQGDIGHDQVFRYMRERFFACTPASLRKEALSWNDSVRCFQSHRQGPPRVALIGDSHAEHLFIGLAEAMPATNVVYYIKNAKLDLEGPHFQAILRFAIGNEDIRSVVLAVSYARWADGAHAAGFERDIGAIVAAFEAAKKKVYFVEDVPGFPVDAARCKFRRIVHSDVVCAASRAVSLGGREAVGAALDALRARYPKLMLARTAVHLCDDVNCHMAKDGTILFRDGHHLNIPGSRFIGRKILEEHPRLAD